jgi:hypothetical protein
MDFITKNYNLNDLFSDNPKIKYGLAKRLTGIAVENPEELYPDFEFFTGLLESENKIIKWTAIDIIGFLSFVDKEKKVDKLLNKLTGYLNSGNLITANHAIECLVNISQAKQEYSDMIIKNLLKIEEYNFDTEECRNIAIGKVLLGLDLMIEKVKNNEQVNEFTKRNTVNTRNATKKKAEKLLKKFGNF